MARQPAEISQQSCFRIDPMPDLHLSGDVRLPLRAYILKCAGDCWYGGLAPAPKIRERIQEQFEADVEKGSSHYCAAHPPESVACVWPVALHAMEAAFFYAMQESLGVTDFRRLGGWVYTSSKPSPLDVMRLTQAHRQLRNTCFDCGQGALCEAQDMPWVQLGLLVQVCGMLGEEQCFQPGPKYIARTCHTTSATISSESNTTTAHSRSCSGGEGEWCASSLSKEVRRISLQPRSRAFIFRAVLGVR